MKTLVAIKKNLKLIPQAPGVYIFKDSYKNVIYVGKAKSLNNRVRSYFQVGLIDKTAKMISHAKTLSYIEVSSEFEALLLEARLVKKYQPKYNIELRDDKSPLYIVITNEEYPRVLTIRQTQISAYPIRNIYGPFVSGQSARSVLKNIRRIIPFSQHKPTNRACVLSQIGLCSPCPSEVSNSEERRKYLLNIKRVNAILSGRARFIQKEIEKEMESMSNNEEFEEAVKLREQKQNLDRLLTPHTSESGYIENPLLIEDIRANELRALEDILKNYLVIEKIRRIECYDIAHLSGTYPTASMVTFIDGVMDKSYYRHFKVKHKNSDVANMQEVMKRRMKYLDKWGRPDLIIVDGGKPQVSKALEIVKDVPLIGLAKQFETLVVKSNDKFIEIRLKSGSAKYLVQRIRDEAHRFARRLHHKQVSNALINS